LIDNQLETLSDFKGYALERENLAVDAEARSFSLPTADATDKLLRYEAHLDRQLYRALDQLERLQRQRGGENVPPPLNINLGKRVFRLFAKQSQEALYFHREVGRQSQASPSIPNGDGSSKPLPERKRQGRDSLPATRLTILPRDECLLARSALDRPIRASSRALRKPLRRVQNTFQGQDIHRWNA
jgi:hypothetical protein